MKNLIYFLLLCIFILPIGIAADDISDVALFWRMDANTTSIKEYVTASGNLTNNGATFTADCGVTTDGSSGCYYFTTNDYMRSSNTTLSSALGTGSFTICGLIKREPRANYDSWIVARQGGAGTNRFYIRGQTDVDKYQVVVWDAGIEDSTVSTTAVVDNVWTQLCIVFLDANRVKIYVNQTEVSYSATPTINNVDGSSGTDIWIGQNAYNGEYFYGYTKWIGVWRRVLNSSEMRAAANTNPIVSAPTPTLTLNTNLINQTQNIETLNYSFNYNGTFTNSNTFLANCSFYQNSVLNKTIQVNLNNTNIYNISWGYFSGYYNISFNCSNYENSASSGIYSLRVDSIPPEIKIGSTFENNSVYYQLDVLTTYFNFTDDNLYAYNITFFDANGLILENYFSTNLSGVTFAENRTSRTLTTLGNYSILSEAWDSHTAAEIQDYKITETRINDTIIKSFDGVKITAEADLFTTKKEYDRYTFDLSFKKENPVVYVECKNPHIMGNSIYKGHIVCFDEKKWVDFEGVKQTPTLKKISENKIEVSFTNIKDTEIITFKSIGDLNHVTKKYYYEVKDKDSLSAEALNNIADSISGAAAAVTTGFNFIGYIVLLILNLIVLYLLILNRIDNVFSFFNGVFSLVLIVVFWPIVQILSYLTIGVLIINMMLFFKENKGVGKTWG